LIDNSAFLIKHIAYLLAQAHEDYFRLLLAHFLHHYKKYGLRCHLTESHPRGGGRDRSGVCAPPPPTTHMRRRHFDVPPPWRDVRRPVISCETDRDASISVFIVATSPVPVCVPVRSCAQTGGGGFSFVVSVHLIPLLPVL
jgi:hypothetical protein